VFVVNHLKGSYLGGYEIPDVSVLSLETIPDEIYTRAEGGILRESGLETEIRLEGNSTERVKVEVLDNIRDRDGIGIRNGKK